VHFLEESQSTQVETGQLSLASVKCPENPTKGLMLLGNRKRKKNFCKLTYIIIINFI